MPNGPASTPGAQPPSPPTSSSETIDDSLDLIMTEAKSKSAALSAEEARGASLKLKAAFAETGPLPLSMGGPPLPGSIAVEPSSGPPPGEELAVLQRLALPPSPPLAHGSPSSPGSARPSQGLPSFAGLPAAVGGAGGSGVPTPGDDTDPRAPTFGAPSVPPLTAQPRLPTPVAGVQLPGPAVPARRPTPPIGAAAPITAAAPLASALPYSAPGAFPGAPSGPAASAFPAASALPALAPPGAAAASPLAPLPLGGAYAPADSDRKGGGKLQLSWLQFGGALLIALAAGGLLGVKLWPRVTAAPVRTRPTAVADEARVPEIKPLRRKRTTDETAARAPADKPAPAPRIVEKLPERTAEKPAAKAADRPAEKPAPEATRRETARAAEKEATRRPAAKPAPTRAPAKVATTKRKEKGWVDPFAQ